MLVKYMIMNKNLQHINLESVHCNDTIKGRSEITFKSKHSYKVTFQCNANNIANVKFSFIIYDGTQSKNTKITDIDNITKIEKNNINYEFIVLAPEIFMVENTTKLVISSECDIDIRNIFIEDISDLNTSIINKNSNTSIINKNSNTSIGIIGRNANTGLGVMTSVYEDIINKVNSVKSISVIDIFEINDRNANDACQYIYKWIISNNIKKLIIFEPVKNNIWDVLSYIKNVIPDIEIFGIPMIDITRKSEVKNHNVFDKVLCSTMTTYSILKKEGLNNLIYVGWCVDTSKFYPDLDRINYHKDIYELYKKANVDRWKFGINFFHNAGWGGDEFRKNTESVVLAFDEICNKIDYIKLHIHTQRPINDYPKRMLDIISRNNDIIVTEGDLDTNEIIEMTRKADVSVLPSKWEGLGIPFYESLACGVPVITVDNCPMNEIIIHNHNGLCCKFTNDKIINNPSPLNKSACIMVDDLAKKMHYIADIKNRKMLYDMSMVCLETIENKYTIEQLAKNVCFAIGILKTNILFAAEYYYPIKGGAEISIHSVLKILKGHGYECYGLCFKDNIGNNYGRIDQYSIDGINIITCPKEVANEIILEVNPCLILTQLNYSSYIIDIAKKSGISSILFIRSFAEIVCGSSLNYCDNDILTCGHKCSTSRETIMANSNLFVDATHIIANSRYSSDVVNDVYNRDCDILYPNFKDVVDDIIVNISENKYDIDGYILFIKPTLIKGVNIFIDIAKKMDNRKFLAVGHINDEYKSKIDNIDNIEHIPHIGSIEKMNHIYSGASIVIVPSTILEGFGRVPIEAMLNGIPVISSGRGGLKESCGGCIIIPDYKNVNEWIKEINNILDDKKYNNKLRERCIKFSNMFISESIDIIDIIERILNHENIKEV